MMKQSNKKTEIKWGRNTVWSCQRSLGHGHPTDRDL